jgi:hypothetical protein
MGHLSALIICFVGGGNNVIQHLPIFRVSIRATIRFNNSFLLANKSSVKKMALAVLNEHFNSIFSVVAMIDSHKIAFCTTFPTAMKYSSRVAGVFLELIEQSFYSSVRVFSSTAQGSDAATPASRLLPLGLLRVLLQEIAESLFGQLVQISSLIHR